MIDQNTAWDHLMAAMRRTEDLFQHGLDGSIRTLNGHLHVQAQMLGVPGTLENYQTAVESLSILYRHMPATDVDTYVKTATHGQVTTVDEFKVMVSELSTVFYSLALASTRYGDVYNRNHIREVFGWHHEDLVSDMIVMKKWSHAVANIRTERDVWLRQHTSRRATIELHALEVRTNVIHMATESMEMCMDRIYEICERLQVVEAILRDEPVLGPIVYHDFGFLAYTYQDLRRLRDTITALGDLNCEIGRDPLLTIISSIFDPML